MLWEVLDSNLNLWVTTGDDDKLVDDFSDPDLCTMKAGVTTNMLLLNTRNCVHPGIQDTAPILNTSAKWTSSNPDVVKIDSSTGKITSLKKGTSTITAKIGGASDSCKITVSGTASASTKDSSTSKPKESTDNDDDPISDEPITPDFTGNHKDEDGNIYYYEDGERYTGEHTGSDGETYYYEDGQKYTGEYTSPEEEITYYYKNGIKYTGWEKQSNVSYYYKEGLKHTGTLKVKKNKTIYLSKKKTFKLKKGKTYYLKDGKILTGWADVDGVSYYYSKGFKYTGTVKNKEVITVHPTADTEIELAAGKSYYVKSGKLYNGFRKISGVHYYYKDGTKYTGTLEVTKKKTIYVKKHKKLTLKKGKTYTIKKGKVVTK